MFWKYFSTLCFASYFYCCYGIAPLKVIIDTDAGGDDAVAIFLALAVPGVEVMAITCTYGNTKETNVEMNVLKTLTIAKRSKIPVYGGAASPLLENYTDTGYFGKDGFGDVKFDREITARVDRSKHAAVAMIDLVKQHPGKITILTLGPTTNVALAASLDSNFTKNVKRFYVMGSLINRSSCNKKDFNFGLDPESNAIFLSSTKDLKVVIVPKDATMKHKISKKWRLEVLGKLSSTAIKFLNKVENAALQKRSDWSKSDPLTTALMIWPSLVTSQYKGRMSGIVTGPCRRFVSVDRSENNFNVEIVENYDLEGFKSKLLDYF